MKFISLSKRYVGSWAIVLLRENRSPSRFFTHLHVSMRALFLVAFFSFPHISNLVPYNLADMNDPHACHLTLYVIFTPREALLPITHTKTIQFRERVLEIPLPRISGSPLWPVTALTQYLASVQLPLRSPSFVCNSQGVYRPILAHQYNAFI